MSTELYTIAVVYRIWPGTLVVIAVVYRIWPGTLVVIAVVYRIWPGTLVVVVLASGSYFVSITFGKFKIWLFASIESTKVPN